MIGYICLNERKIDLNHFRYEIGKIYKSKINCFNTLEDLLIYYHYQRSMRFFKVKFSEKNSTLLCNDVERIIKEFKIVKEVDYSKLTNSDNYGIQLLSTEKNKEESMLEKFSSSDNPSALIAVINAGVDKYLDKLIKRNKSVSLILSKYKRKKDIERFINSKDSELVSIIAGFGISKYLDYLSRKAKSGEKKYVIAAFGGRIKDVKKYLEMISEKNDYSFSSVVKTIIEKLDRNNTRPICFEGNNIFSSLEYNFSFSELFCKYIEKYKKYINLNFIPFDYFYKNRCLFDVIDGDELKTNPIEKINLIKSKEINNISNSTYYSNVSKGRYIFSKYIKSIFSIIDLYSEKEAEYFAKKVDASNLKIVSCDEEFFINIKNSNLDFYEVVDYIFDIFKNEGFRYIDFDFMNDYFKLIKFSESFKRTNLISYMMKNTNLLFSRFNSFNF